MTAATQTHRIGILPGYWTTNPASEAGFPDALRLLAHAGVAGGACALRIGEAPFSAAGRTGGVTLAQSPQPAGGWHVSR